jgi:hypothetical protein
MSKIEVDAIEPQSGTTLTIGASGDTITIPSGATLTNSGTATGFGKVLQVVQGTRTTNTQTTSTSFVTTNLEVSITPSSASNKVLVFTQGDIEVNNARAFFDIFRDSTAVSGVANGLATAQYVSFNGAVAPFYLDSPNTTSAITYSLRFKHSTGSGTATFNGNPCVATIVAIEIAG